MINSVHDFDDYLQQNLFFDLKNDKMKQLLLLDQCIYGMSQIFFYFQIVYLKTLKISYI